MNTNRNTCVALVAIAGLTSALPGLAQTPDARAGSVVVETNRPVPKAAPRPADGTVQPIIVVGGRGRHVAKPTRKAGAGTTVPAKTATPP